jgi:integrase/recombinase XerD
MLTQYRRHKKDCKHRGCRRNACSLWKRRTDGQILLCRCSCPIWADGKFDGVEIRRSLKENSWDDADRALRHLKESCERLSTSLKEAADKFLEDARARGFVDMTIYKYRSLFSQLHAFAAHRGLYQVKELDVDLLGEFRATWKDGACTNAKKLERLRAWLGFCERRKWIPDNPARHLRPPKFADRPTMPFTQNEMIRIFATLETKYPARAGLRNAQRLKAFVLLLRYSGLRIGDAVRTDKTWIAGGKIFLYTQKTGVAVHRPLPKVVLDALEAAPHSAPSYFFWTGRSTLRSAVGKWQRRLHTLFELAEVEKGHAHRFRDTFAVELLLTGTPIENVSVLLGHRSVRMTERYYAPWVRARQEQLEEELARTWEHDPVLMKTGYTAGTPQVHGKPEHPT